MIAKNDKKHLPASQNSACKQVLPVSSLPLSYHSLFPSYLLQRDKSTQYCIYSHYFISGL